MRRYVGLTYCAYLVIALLILGTISLPIMRDPAMRPLIIIPLCAAASIAITCFLFELQVTNQFEALQLAGVEYPTVLAPVLSVTILLQVIVFVSGRTLDLSGLPWPLAAMILTSGIDLSLAVGLLWTRLGVNALVAGLAGFIAQALCLSCVMLAYRLSGSIAGIFSLGVCVAIFCVLNHRFSRRYPRRQASD